MEEAFEVTMASMGNEGKKRKIEEISDLFYITIVFMVANNISLEELAEEMIKRQK